MATPSDGWTVWLLPEANGLPAAFSAPSCTLPAGSISSSEPQCGNPPAALVFSATGSSGRENSALRAGTPASRQSPSPDTSAYSKVWVQCCNWKLEPSGAVRRGGSIQVPDGQPVHERISEVCSVPSESTAKPGIPRLSTATVRSSNAPSPDGASCSTTISKSPRSSTTDATAPSSADPAMTSTGSARTPRRSAPGTHSSVSGATGGTHTLAAPALYSWRLSSSVYTGSASAKTAAVKAFSSGPPSAIRASGRLESTVRSP